MIDLQEDLAKLYKTEKQRAILAKLCSLDFRLYLDVMFRAVNSSLFTFKPFHNDLIKKLQDIADGKNTKRNLLINIPVGAGKSIIVEYFITWCFARSINNCFCYISHSDRLISRLSKEAKDIVDSFLWKKLYGQHLKQDDKSKVNWSFAGGANRTGLTASTMGGGVTGLDAGNPMLKGFNGALIIDDPIDVGNVVHQLAREECISNYDNKLATRRRTPRTPTILIMQRTHIEDLSGWVLDNEPDDWDMIKIPAISNGISFWEEKYPVKELAHIERINAYKFQSQYQQEPLTAGGEMININWFNYYDSISGVDLKKVYITADTAMTVQESSDYTVFMCWGEDSGNVYLLDMLRGKWNSVDLRKNMLKFWKKWEKELPGHKCKGVYIENKASGIGLIQDILTNTRIPVFKVNPVKDKTTRVEEVLPTLECGRVHLPQSKEYALNKDLLSECQRFTREGQHKHDDIVDCLTMALNIFRKNEKNTTKRARMFGFRNRPEQKAFSGLNFF